MNIMKFNEIANSLTFNRGNLILVGGEKYFGETNQTKMALNYIYKHIYFVLLIYKTSH